MYFMHWTRSLRRFAEQQHLASRYVLLTWRKISGPDLLAAEALADVATIENPATVCAGARGALAVPPTACQFPRTGLSPFRGGPSHAGLY
jgi:hypothetical protein